MKTFELSEIENDETNSYQVVELCSECGTKINETKPMSGKEISENWTAIIMSAPLSNPPCPKCGASTYSDCNMHTNTRIIKTGL